MAMAEAESNGFEFLSDPVDRFSLMDLSGGNCVPSNEAIEALICAPSDSSMGDAGDRALTMEADLNSTCDDVPLSAPPSEPSTGKDDPQGTWLDREVYPVTRSVPLVHVLPLNFDSHCQVYLRSYF
ncbi:hypothetical protein VPH35_074633 [Triticum aestivum]|uniref:uncharacterized protein isoform X2 n=1 Tax=Triticum aestivum TaxID=4565 RepID=UPI001D014A96|nr:uncharacterized protein LOC123089261 isoform X2 [Triticum aestivum]